MARHSWGPPVAVETAWSAAGGNLYTCRHSRAECEDLERLETLIRPLGPAAVRDYLDRLRYLSMVGGQ